MTSLGKQMIAARRSRDCRDVEMKIVQRNQFVRAGDVPVRWRPVRAGHTDTRPRPEGSCILFAKCGNMAGPRGVCAACAAKYRRKL